ncbi:zinc finger MYM-type protein 1-like [Sipha flava]|uniref:Zinc finger MYM-type protein 1-like n=1 Tax=Sipha flava TaxID=143950 RepID=A0A8B8F7K6_9HEMI|nr:zinc finger MYM-type protein 1-like [Sipha flava]
MPPKKDKPSGAQYRKRRAQAQLELEKNTHVKHNNEETLTSPTLTYFPCDDNNFDIDINSSKSAFVNKTVEMSDKPITDVSKSVAFISQPDLFDPYLWPDNRQNNLIDIVIKMGPRNNDWKHMTTILISHEKSPEHFTAYKKWHECELRLNLGRCIDNDLQRVMNTEVQYWKSILERLISITLYLSKHNLAFRGSSDKLFERNNGNYLGLVELLGKYDNNMKEYLNRITTQKLNLTYCSKDIQNELKNLMASKVLEIIQQKVQVAKYFSVILECTPDVSHSEKMSFTIRFVDENNGNLQVAEHFIGFREVSESTGESLTELLLKTLKENNLDIMNCRGQGYDNGANMKGHKKCVQARILALNPKAAFMPCGCHSLNLVISDTASKSKESITLFGIVQRIFVLFSASVYRWQVLKSHLPNLTIKPLCTTRWESRIDSVKAIRYQTKEVYDALIEVAESSKADARTRNEASSLGNQLLDFKYQETGYADASNSSREIAESLGIDPIIKEVRVRRKKTFFDENTDQDFLISAEERFKREFFYTLVDTVRESIKERFTQFENHKQLWGFLYNLEKLPSS